MSILYSTRSKIAIRAMIFLANNQKDQPIFVDRIGFNIGVSTTTLQSIIARLGRYHLVFSVLGHHGGITLNKPAKEIRVIDIVSAIDGPQLIVNKCLRGLGDCIESSKCSFHNNHDLIQEKMNRLIGDENLENLINYNRSSVK
jgi:Rrf2 family protein